MEPRNYHYKLYHKYSKNDPDSILIDSGTVKLKTGLVMPPFSFGYYQSTCQNDAVEEYPELTPEIKVSPVPAGSSANLEFYLLFPGSVNIELLNNNGKIIFYKKYENLVAGTNQIQINLANIPSGAYHGIMIGSHNRQQHFNLIILK